MLERRWIDFARMASLGTLLLLVMHVAQAAQPGPPQFEFLGQTVDPEHVTLDYRLPYDGVVELRIFSAEGELIWQNQYVNERGENRIRLKTAAFATGNNYSVLLNYKKDVYKVELEMK